MIKTSPSDDKMLFERPLPQAIRLYGLQLGILAGIALVFFGSFVGLVFLERTFKAPSWVWAPPGGSDSAIVAITLIPVLTGITIFEAVVIVRGRHRRERTERELRREAIERQGMQDLQLGANAYNKGDLIRAETSARKSIDFLAPLVAQNAADVSTAAPFADAHLLLGWISLARDDTDGAKEYVRLAQRYLGQIEVLDSLALTLLGDIAVAEEKYEEANSAYRDALLHMEWGQDYLNIILVALRRADALDALNRTSEADAVRAFAQDNIDRLMMRHETMPFTTPAIRRPQTSYMPA